MLNSLSSEKDYITKNRNIVNISFIIPAHNEEKHLPKVLATINQLISDLVYEIIVVDNGSTDSTVNIAQEFGAMVLQDSSKTIAGLRNLGAEYAMGKILVFLDADVIITPKWAKEIVNLTSKLDENNRIVTGSHCGISANPSWIEKYWFLPMTLEKSNYMNSGHLIIDRNVFHEIGGFNSDLITGEDWEFCMRAKQKGIAIINNPELSVIHEGYPKTLRQFIRREKWHGIQDFYDMKSFINSKPAIFAVLYWLLGILGIILSVYYKSITYIVSAIMINSTLCLLVTLYKRKQLPINMIFYFLLYNAYFFARGLSFYTVSIRFGRNQHKKSVSWRYRV